MKWNTQGIILSLILALLLFGGVAIGLLKVAVMLKYLST